MAKTAVENLETNQGSQNLSGPGVAAYRALRVLEVLMEHTGETKAIPIDRIARILEEPDDGRRPVRVNRKGLFSTVSALRAAGYEIEFRRGAGYRLLTRPLSDEDVVRLHGMVMRNRSMPKQARHDLACHLIALASADIRPYLEPPHMSDEHAVRKTISPEVPQVDTCELIDRAVADGVIVDFDLEAPPWCQDEVHERCSMQPLALKQWNGASYMLGTVPDSAEGDCTLRTIQVSRMHNVSCTLVSGVKLIARDMSDGSDEAVQ